MESNRSSLPVALQRLSATVVYVPRKSMSVRTHYRVSFTLNPELLSLACIQFQNHFCASIVIDQLVADTSSAEESWRRVLPRRVLMRDPHSEEDAHIWAVVDASDFVSHDWSSQGEQVLRICIEQPSPTWRHYELRGVTLWACFRESADPVRTSPLASTPMHAATMRLLKAELHLARCFQRVATMRRMRNALVPPSDEVVRSHLATCDRAPAPL